MPLQISKECELSEDPDWTDREPMGGASYFYTRAELPSEGDKIIIAMAGNPNFFSRLTELGHVFVADPVEDTEGTVAGAGHGTIGHDMYMRLACVDENRRALMAQEGESETIEFINSREGFIAELTFKLVAETSAAPK